MKRLVLTVIVIATALALAGCSGGDQQDTQQEVAQTVPPLLDRELFFGDPEISGSQLSPDGRYMSFIKPYEGVRNLWVKETDAPFETARPVTADRRPVPGYFWSRDGAYLLYVQDRDGDENFHVWAVDPDAEPAAETGVPPARDLTPIDGIRAALYSVPKNQPEIMIVGLNDRDPRYHDVYKVNIRTGERTLMLQNDDEVGAYQFDLDGDVRLAVRQLPGGGTELLRVGLDGGLERIMTATFEENLNPVRFHEDGRHCYVVTNRGEDVDLDQLMLLDVETGVMQFVERDPEGEVDFGGTVFHPETDELIATSYLGDRLRIYPRTDEAAQILEDLRKKLPDGEFYINSTTRDMSKMLLALTRDVDPGSVYLYDREAGTVTLQYRSRPELPTQHLAPMKPVRYQARDGMTLHAYLTLPRGVRRATCPW